jgi:hypothetical protein
MIKDSDIHLKFELDLPVPVEGIGNFKAVNVLEIGKLGEELYNNLLSTLMFSKKNLKIEQDLSEFTDVQLLYTFVHNDVHFAQMLFQAIELHFDSKPLLHEEGFIYFGELREENVLDDDKFQFIKKLIAISNNLKEPKKEEEYQAGNERAKKFMEKLKKKKEQLEKVKKKDAITLHSMISAVGWKSNSFFDVHKLNIYQLYDGFNRLGMIDNYHYTLTGIYSGSIDGSKIKLPEINWANNIKLN